MRNPMSKKNISAFLSIAFLVSFLPSQFQVSFAAVSTATEQFVRGVNLNGGDVTINSDLWKGETNAKAQGNFSLNITDTTPLPKSDFSDSNNIRNSGFEADGAYSQSPKDWLESGTNTDASFVEMGYPVTAHTGSYYLKHYKASPYTVDTYQYKAGLAYGMYTLRAWVLSNHTNSYIYAKSGMGDKLTQTIPETYTWTLVVIPNIRIYEDGACTIGVSTNATFSSAWTIIDDVELYRQVDSSSVSIPTPPPISAGSIGNDKFLCYNFDESGGTNLYDSSGYWKNASLVGGAYFTKGIKGSALDFNGMDGYASLPQGAIDSLNDFTISLWVNPRSTGKEARIFQFAGVSNHFIELCQLDWADQLSFNISNGSNIVEVKADPLKTNVWSHVAITLSGGYVTIYVNGVERRRISNCSIKLSDIGITYNNYIGRGYVQGQYFNGKIDDFNVYNYAMSSAQIKQVSDMTVSYRFDENSGTTALDSTGNGWNAALQTGATFVQGKSGNALDLNGSTGYAKLPDGIVSTLNDYTIACWVKCDNTTSPNFRVFDFGYGDGSQNMYLTPRTNKNTLRFAIFKNNGLGEQIIDAPAIPQGVWKHVAVTFSGTTGIIYVDGVEVGRNANISYKPSDMGFTTNNLIGKSLYSWDPYMNGQIDDFKIYRRALNPSEIKTMTENKLYYRFGEYNTVNTMDSSGYGNNGVLKNGACFVMGRDSRALNLDGVDGYVSMPQGIVNSLTDFTVAAWVKYNDPQKKRNFRLFDFGNDSTSYMYITTKSSTNTLQFGISTGSWQNEQKLDGPTLPTGVWKHVAVSFTGKTGKMYVDGVEVASTTGISLRPSDLGITTNNYIGKSQYSDPYLDGQVDDFAIFSRGLSADEIKGLCGINISAVSTPTPVPTAVSAPVSASFATMLSSADYGSNITATFTGLQTNNVYRVYLYTKEMESDNKRSFNVYAQDMNNPINTVNSGKLNEWMEKGPYTVKVLDDGKLTVKCVATKDKVSLSGIKVCKVTGYPIDFSDVPFSSPYYIPVRELAALGIINGNGSSSIRTYDSGDGIDDTYNIKGSFMAEVMFRVMKLTLTAKEKDSTVRTMINKWNTMADVPIDFWAYNYMRAYYNYFAKERKDSYLLRQDIALAQVGALRLDYDRAGKVFVKDPALDYTAALSIYVNDPNSNVEQKYKYAVELALENGVFSTKTKNGVTGLYPTDKVSRGEAAQMIFKLINAKRYEDSNFDIATLSSGVTKASAPRITARTLNIKMAVLVFDRLGTAYRLSAAGDWKTADQLQYNITNADYSFIAALDKNINKPMDWNIINPHPAINPATNAPYSKDSYANDNIDTTIENEDKYKRFKYWELHSTDITNAEETARDYDVLFTTTHKSIRLCQADIDTFESLVDKGGQLWFEDCWDRCETRITDMNDNKIEYLGFESFIYEGDSTRYRQVKGVNGNHQLLNGIFTLDDNEINKVGDMDEYSWKGTSRVDENYSRSTSSVAVESIIYNQSDLGEKTPAVLSRTFKVGGKENGRVVVTLSDIACGICDINKPGFGNAIEDYKFSYNLIGWLSKVAVDFSEMDGVMWSNINVGQTVDITATITNLGSKYQEYNLNYNVNPLNFARSNWTLTNPVSNYITMNTDINSIYYKKLGFPAFNASNPQTCYPNSVKLEAGESIQITYSFKILDNSFGSHNFKLTASSIYSLNDTDFTTYKLAMNSTGVPQISAKSDEIVCSPPSYGISKSFDINVNSHLLSDQATPDVYTYIMYFTLKKDGSIINPSAYIDESRMKNAKAALYDTATGLSQNMAVDSAKAVQIGGQDYIAVTIKDVPFSKKTQVLKFGLCFGNLANKSSYALSGHSYISEVNQISPESAPTAFNFDYNLLQPTITKRITTRRTGTVAGRQNILYGVELDYNLKQYTNETASDNIVTIYTKSGGTINNYGQPICLPNDSPSFDGTVSGYRVVHTRDGNHNASGTIILTDVPSDDYYIKIRVKSDALGQQSEKQVTMFLKVDIN